MNDPFPPFLQTVAAIGLAVQCVAVLLSFVRLLIGPTLADRVVALDMIAILLVGLLVLHGLAASQPEPLQVATVLALVNFLGTTAFAVYIQRREGRAAPEEARR
jgi:multicomponent Na+:H+ antiporter subunit F